MSDEVEDVQVASVESGTHAEAAAPETTPRAAVVTYELIDKPEMLMGVITYEDGRVAIVRPTYSPTRIGFQFRFAGDRRHYAADNPLVNMPWTLREELHAAVVARELARLKSQHDPAGMKITVDPKQMECDSEMLGRLRYTLHQEFYPDASWRELDRLKDLTRRMENGPCSTN